jgi:hypothetical protein
MNRLVVVVVVVVVAVAVAVAAMVVVYCGFVSSSNIIKKEIK